MRWETRELMDGDSELWKHYSIEMPRWNNPTYNDTGEEQNIYPLYHPPVENSIYAPPSEPEAYLDTAIIERVMGEGRVKDWDLITSRSPLYLRKACLQIARYFKKELHFDFLQYPEPEAVTPERKTILLFDKASSMSNHIVVVGAIDFVYQPTKKRFVMMWAWVHPYCRGQGRLKELWPTFTALFGQFDLEPPLSRSMAGLVARMRSEAAGAGE